MYGSKAKLYFLFCIHINKPSKALLAQTAKTQYRKFETYIRRKGIARPHGPNSHIHVSVSELYIGVPVLLQENIWTDPGNI